MIERLLRLVRRPPDRVIGPDRTPPYLRRWYLLRNALCCAYLHHIQADDDDRALHDHPWDNCSIVLRGRLVEVLEDGSRRTLRPGAIRFRRAEAAHRLEVPHGPVWTLFLTGRRRRQWGFLCPQGWRHWRDFAAGEHGETIGRGCA